MSWSRRSQIYWLDRIGMWVLRVSIIGLVALVTVQLLMTNDPFRLYLGLNQGLMEPAAKTGAAAPTMAPIDVGSGKAGVGQVEAASSAQGEASLTLSLAGYASLERLPVKVTGAAAGDFSQKELTVAVPDGDILTLDPTAYPYPLEVAISKSSGNLVYPRAGQSITLNHETVMIGPVKLKR
jgi:hypothetical protein